MISGTDADTQIRCNQIWAISLPFSMLDEEKERQVVDTVFEKLYTPYGLRTLSPEDPQFCPFYGGEVLKRDLAYHQGTVWAHPLGAYYLAFLKVYGGNVEKREIYDWEDPVSSKGCFAQAWSVGELLRVYERLEKPDPEGAHGTGNGADCSRERKTGQW